MKTITIEDIRSWNPCYDPSRHLSKKWEGTTIDILEHETIPPQDKLWVVCREEVISAKTLRLFAVWCARQVQHLMTDERSINAIDVAERYANGQATDEELAAASDAAWAASDAAWDASDAAWATARDAAWAARATAWDAAAPAAWDAAGAARGAAQIEHLIEMLREGAE